MFSFSDYLSVVAQFSTSNVHELITLCRIHMIGIRIDLGGVVIVDESVQGKYTINVTMCNCHVIPRPIFQGKSQTILYDAHCIKKHLPRYDFPMNVQMHGDHVVAFLSGNTAHVALPDMEESCEIAQLLGIYDEMIRKRSVNAAICGFVKSRLPYLCYQSHADLVLSKTAFVFRTEEVPAEVMDCVDIRRCYSTALVSFESEWAHFSCFDDVHEAKLSDVLQYSGRYYVTTTNYFPLKGSNWYYHTVLRYAHKCGVDFQVYFGQKASTSYPSNLFKSISDTIKELLPSAHAKTVINRFIGMLKSKSRESVKCFVTRSKDEANAFLRSTMHSYMSYEMGMYICQSPQTQTSVRSSSRHIYDQIIERSWILVHQLWHGQMQCGARLLQIKTDAVTVKYMSQEEKDLYDLDECKYKREIVQLQAIPATDESCSMPEMVNNIEPVEIDHTYEWDGKSVCFVGRAGTSKSTKMKEILDKHDGVVISPTNRAASSFSKGVTIHKFFGIKDINCTTIKSKKIYQLSQSTKLLLVDEVFMCNSWMLEALYQLHLLGTTMVFAGDPYQLPAVSGKALTYRCSTLRACVGDNFLSLSKNMRCGEDLSMQLSVSVMSDEISIPECVPFHPCDFSIRCHLTYTNLCSFKLNDLVLKHEIRRHRTVLWFDTSGKWFVSTGSRCVPDGCIAFTRNSPVTLRETCAYGTRNERVVVKSFDSTKIQINDKKFKIVPEMSYILRLAYSMTIHKAQGCTISERHQIHELNKIKRNKVGSKLLYVALTRTSKIHYVSICDNCCCESITTKQLSQRDLFM